MKIEEILKLIKKEFEGYQITNIKEYDSKIYVFLDKQGEFDIPVLWFNKNTEEKGAIDLTDDLAFEVLQKGKDVNDYLLQEQNENQEGEDTDMDASKIRTLLKRYGAEDTEIENFMEDLENLKDEIEEDDDFNYLDNDTMEKLKATEEGKDLIMNAPKMAKEELKAAIKKYLSNAQ